MGMLCDGCHQTPAGSLYKACFLCISGIQSGTKDEVATGPCVGCGENNYTAHSVSICAFCVRRTRSAAGRMMDSQGGWHKAFTVRNNDRAQYHVRLTARQMVTLLMVLENHRDKTEVQEIIALVCRADD